MIKLTPERTFRRTPGVHFADIGVPGSNGIDLVEHSGPSVSPPNSDGRRCWYVHKHQVDNNRVIHGERLFELFNPKWVDKHWFVFLTEESGALEIPVGCFHRSYSGINGSLLLNHAIRDAEYDELKEFHPCHCPTADEYPPLYHGITPLASAHLHPSRRTSMSDTKYQVRLINGKTIDNLSYEEATKYFYSHAGSSVRPWPVQKYKAP